MKLLLFFLLTSRTSISKVVLTRILDAPSSLLLKYRNFIHLIDITLSETLGITIVFNSKQQYQDEDEYALSDSVIGSLCSISYLFGTYGHFRIPCCLSMSSVCV